MISFVKKYKAFFIGLIITRVLAWVLEYYGIILIDEDEILTNVLGFLFYWFLISIFIHKIQFFNENIGLVLKISGLLLFFILILIIDSTIDMPDNPMTIFLLIVFYLAITYFLAPKFFNKYKVFIFSIYGLFFSIFLYFRLFSGSFDEYSQQKTELFLLFVAPLPVFFGLWAYQQWIWFQTLKAEKAQAELSMLQAQINPHFFFNTLNNLYALTIKNSSKAPEVILKLSDMMRYTIYEGKKDWVTLQEEIDYLKNYIQLHEIRYKKQVDIQFNHQIDGNTKVSPLLFIILLENAFKHGVEMLSENAYIHMNIKKEAGYIVFDIENNFGEIEKKEDKGIGLKNLKQRLNLLFSKNFEFSVHKSSGIYKATLKIPAYA